MTLSPQEAAESLQDIERTQRHSATLRGYNEASPHLILWGVLWAVGYGLTGAMPARGGAIWAVIILIGLSAGLMVMRRSGFGLAARRYAAVTTTLLLFCLASLAVLMPAHMFVSESVGESASRSKLNERFCTCVIGVCTRAPCPNNTSANMSFGRINATIVFTACLTTSNTVAPSTVPNHSPIDADTSTTQHTHTVEGASWLVVVALTHVCSPSWNASTSICFTCLLICWVIFFTPHSPSHTAHVSTMD